MDSFGSHGADNPLLDDGIPKGIALPIRVDPFDTGALKRTKLFLSWKLCRTMSCEQLKKAKRKCGV